MSKSRSSALPELERSQTTTYRGPVGPAIAASRPRSRVVEFLACLVGLYAITNGLSISLSLAARIAYAIVIAFCLVAIVLGMAQRHPRRFIVPVALAAWSLLMSVELLQAPTVAASPVNVITDYLVSMSPLLFLAVLTMHARGRSSLVVGYIIITYMSFAGAVVGFLTSGGLRFEAPQIVAITGTWVIFLAPRRLLPSAPRLIRATSLIMVALLVPIILASRSRTALIVWLLSGLISYFYFGLAKGRRMITFLIIATLAAIAFAGFQTRVDASAYVGRLLQQARLSEIAAGQLDVSSESRLLEVHDVVSTMDREGAALDHLLGFGHGASYVPDESKIEPNIDPETGRVHNIHVSWFMIWFRYGYFGVAFFIALLVSAAASCIRDMKQNKDIVSGVSLVTLAMYLLDLTLRNSLADPEFAFVLAAIFVSPSLGKREATNDGS